MLQRRFQAEVASVLILINTDKRCRPSASPLPLTKRKVVNLPCGDVRKDKIAHWTRKSEEEGAGCVKKTIQTLNVRSATSDCVLWREEIAL